MSASDTAAADFFSSVQMKGVTLWETSVARVVDASIDVGQVHAKLNLDPSFDSDSGVLHYLVRGDFEFRNADEQLFLELMLSYLCSYAVESEDSPTDEQVEAFVPSVMMHVTPYQREFLTNITSRLGIPAFTLPLMRPGDVLANLRTSED